MTEVFAARRREIFVKADEELGPSVGKALVMYENGEADWRNELIDDASVIWMEVFEEESPNADPERFLPRFREALGESLAQTDQPEGAVDPVQTTRVTRWIATYTVNDATFRAAGARGARFMRWVTMNDRSVRESHVLANGQVTSIGGTFDIEGYDLHYPGEPVGPPSIWINCRCVVQAAARPGESAMTPTTFAIVDEEVVEDEDLPTDDLDDDEEEITEVPVHGVLAPEGVPTGDGRMFAAEALTHRELPLPILYQDLTGDGHGGSARVGRIDEIFREGNEVRFRGAVVLTKAFAPQVIEGILDGTVRGISVDVDDVELEMSDETMDELLDGKMPLTTFSKARVAGVTIVAIPAFQEAFIGLGHEFADELSEEALAACAACADEGPDDDENPDIEMGYDVYESVDNWLSAAQAQDGNFKDYSAEERRRMAGNGQALPDGSFPIANVEDLRNAIQSIGRASDPSAAKAHIKKRASALGESDLIPEGWRAKTDEYINGVLDMMREMLAKEPELLLASAFAPGTKDGPGWITHPIPTSRIRRYWTHGKGAAKIRWGQGGDFNRCRKQLAKYIANPDWLAGACANMHKEALGIWPSTHAARRRGKVLRASGEAPAPIFNFVAAAVHVFDSNLFARVDLEDPRVGIQVEGDHVFGYMAQWGVCHIGITGVCTEAPASQTDYWYYATGVVDTDQGPVHVGQITMDTGHASLKSNAKIAAAHYDNTGSAVADVAVGEDAFGIWFSGVLRSSITDAQLHALRASGRISGDWRTIGGSLEMVAGLVVNVPGLPIPHTMVASADGVQTALVAAGVVHPTDTQAPAVTASVTIGADPEMIAAIVRTTVDEYRHAEKRAERVTPLRAALRDKQVAALRSKLKG